MITPRSSPPVASIVFGAARVALGVLWLVEGITKYRARLGAADIGFVVDAAESTSRVPDYFAAFAISVMRPLSDLFGVAIPLLETGLGVALTIGVLTLPAALVSILTLLLHWSSDQLIEQYPVMALLSVLLMAWPAAASRYSVTSAVSALQGRRHGRSLALEGNLRRWL